MSYDYRLTVCTPISLVSQANSIALSMDPDVGGAKSFSNLKAININNNEFVVCDVWIRANFATQANAMLTNPQLLYAACLSDYSARWVELTAPTLTECTEFINKSIIHIEPRSTKTIVEILTTLNLTLIVVNT